ncbi:hypothetical protein LASUN_12940 [Lentilactobacillus sunkii]|uniref:Uncharacterized protein n=1 Tax=Lentilactobacillus sunkii TaxID=481719 RepID=A0A1E7XCB1_9LACO|nr:hypothetical protein [Lentilactobacillus sunkii]OFA10744.1 hypothetical protein LASUN_12940 [Lentilactobacillus sunkii]
MTTEFKDPHAWFVVVDDSGNKQTIYNNEMKDNNYPFAFEVNFSDQPTPAQNTVTIYNMSKEHRDFYHKGNKCELDFNWGSAQKTLCVGYLSEIGVNQSDGTTENLVITYTEGTDYKNVEARKIRVEKKKKVNQYTTVKKKVPGKYVKKRVHYYTTEHGKKVGHYKYEKTYQKATYTKKRVKHKATKTFLVNMTFKKGKTLEQIIKAVASKAGIKISKIQLHKNTPIKKAYTASGKPLTVLKSLVSKAESKMLYIRGDLTIMDPKANKRTWFVITDDILMQPPTMEEDDNGVNTWQLVTPLIPEVSTLTGIIMQSKYLKGKYFVSAGQHSSDGTNPQTQMSIQAI